ncbi:MAG: ATP-dependent DNA helicase RecG [Planctomycetaceae bacterium]|nr:ATP-dependent DNA helicase RecG [Planctomycetaceae bacterium]
MDSNSANWTLATPAQFLKGVGPDRAQQLERLGLRTAQDLLFFFPRDYLDLSERLTVEELRENEPASLLVEVVEMEQRVTRSGKTMLGVLLKQGSHVVRASWFNQPFMREKFRQGQTLMLSGAPRRRGLRWEFTHPRITYVDRTEDSVGEILPIYSLTEGLKQHEIRRITQIVVKAVIDQVPEVLPQEFIETERICGIQKALQEVHQPTDQNQLTAARDRLIFQELLVMQLGLAMRQQQLAAVRSAPELKLTTKINARIRRLFPFELTQDQNQAILEITSDLGSTIPMNRLLQGDVGSGKTAVAAYAMLLTVAHAHQAVLMAPTEVLARQHFQTLSSLLSHSQVEMRLLTGSSTNAERRNTLADVADGTVDILIGTQAIIQQQLEYQQLGLVIIDEQHKFGVIQRAMLRQESLTPHYLVMTATPIPRTMAMTVFGDLEVSALRGRPPGRQPVHTYLADESQRDRWWEFYRRKLREGRQGFVISPLVHDNDDETTSAEAALENLTNGPLAEFRLDLLHGRMSSAEKQAAMDRFHRGDTQVLVATSVVEVGIDVPNANLMTIEHGERFGLAQLHQLRGRIGRGEHSGFVCVFATPKLEEAQERLQAFVETNDGFELSEVDFQLRGPGELFGTKQHGLPPLMVADLRRDASMLERARTRARQLLQNDPGLRNPDFARLRKMVLKRYGNVLQLSDVG